MGRGGDFLASVHGVALGRMGTGGVCAGCTFADFDGYITFFAFGHPSVSLVQCTFAGNTLFPEDSGAAVIEAQALAGSPQQAPTHHSGGPGAPSKPATLPAS